MKNLIGAFFSTEKCPAKHFTEGGHFLVQHRNASVNTELLSYVTLVETDYIY